ncbi:MAG: hypothetical protein HeimC2_12500 [Candidatus Heimdallarchaeota archaeon LC_2]|nr:MAG: hypothetical protein HeimC2_12500 [Candidatus Heimdallarchaeota archaeon LC_2]
MLGQQFIKNVVLVKEEQYIRSIMNENDMDKIVDLFNQIYPIYITLRAPLLSMEKIQSLNNEVDQYTFFTLNNISEGIFKDETDGFYFSDLIEKIDDFYLLNILYQAIKEIMDHCVRQLSLVINSSLNILLNSFMDNWFLPINLDVELFEMCISVVPFYTIRRFNDRFIFIGFNGNVLLDFIYIKSSGWIELLFYDKEVNLSEVSLWQHKLFNFFYIFFN